MEAHLPGNRSVCDDTYSIGGNSDSCAENNKNKERFPQSNLAGRKHKTRGQSDLIILCFRVIKSEYFNKYQTEINHVDEAYNRTFLKFS